MQWKPLSGKPFQARDWNDQLTTLFAEIEGDAPVEIAFEKTSEINITTKNGRTRAVEVWLLSDADGFYYREDHLLLELRQKPGEIRVLLASALTGKVVIT